MATSIVHEQLKNTELYFKNKTVFLHFYIKLIWKLKLTWNIQNDNNEKRFLLFINMWFGISVSNLNCFNKNIFRSSYSILRD